MPSDASEAFAEDPRLQYGLTETRTAWCRSGAQSIAPHPVANPEALPPVTPADLSIPERREATDGSDIVTAEVPTSQPAPAEAEAAALAQPPATPAAQPQAAGEIAAPAEARAVKLGVAAFAAAILLLLVAYLAVVVPSRWFPSAPAQSWGARDVSLTRGSGELDGSVLVLDPAPQGGTSLISLNTDIRSTDYRAVAWRLSKVPEQADVRMYWRSDYAPSRMNSAPVTVAAGQVLPVDVSAEPSWLGRITGLGLAIRTPAPTRVLFYGVTVKPMGAIEILRDRFAEWLSFETWSGTSLNSITGGAAVQDLPLPLLLAAGAALAALVSYVLLRRAHMLVALPLAIAAIFVGAWFVADLRWTFNLARQTLVTREQYAGKDWHDKHLAAEDGPVFAFIEQVRAKLPATRARVFVVSDQHYLRDRAAYHLYPYNVYFEPYRDVLPPSTALRPGDFLIVYLRRGIQYDPSAQRLRFPDGATIGAELLMVEPGAAAFAIK